MGITLRFGRWSAYISLWHYDRQGYPEGTFLIATGIQKLGDFNTFKEAKFFRLPDQPPPPRKDAA